MQGVIKTLKNGFGFITPEGEAKDLFFHATDVKGGFDSLREGDMVTFDEVPSDRGGMKAGNVTVGGGAGAAGAAGATTATTGGAAAVSSDDDEMEEDEEQLAA